MVYLSAACAAHVAQCAYVCDSDDSAVELVRQATACFAMAARCVVFLQAHMLQQLDTLPGSSWNDVTMNQYDRTLAVSISAAIRNFDHGTHSHAPILGLGRVSWSAMGRKKIASGGWLMSPASHV